MYVGLWRQFKTSRKGRKIVGSRFVVRFSIKYVYSLQTVNYVDKFSGDFIDSLQTVV